MNTLLVRSLDPSRAAQSASMDLAGHTGTRPSLPLASPLFGCKEAYFYSASIFHSQ
jgi:hypothetical protein